MCKNTNSDILESAILIAVSTDNEEKTLRSLDELEELANTAGAHTVCKVVQNRESFHPATYIGKGKIDEVRSLIDNLEATTIICDDELSPAQLSNLQDALDAKVIDRTILILDIFARHATTAEGKIQVELAQLKYRASRLTGKGNALSRLGGGIGTRGPGETKLETDRRLIRARVGQLSQELKDIVRHRETTRKSRGRNQLPTFAIVGYTNAGKSTLLNHLTNADVLSEDMLFATLDPTTRAYTLPTGEKILLTDTVGFISKLPHHLIEAFKSTLEEAKYADYIIHVVDSSNPECESHMKVCYDTLEELGITGKTIITLLNKSDLVSDIHIVDEHAQHVLKISARTGAGLDDLSTTVSQILAAANKSIDVIIEYKNAAIISDIRTYGNLISEEYLPEGIHVVASIPASLYGRLGNIM